MVSCHLFQSFHKRGGYIHIKSSRLIIAIVTCSFVTKLDDDDFLIDVMERCAALIDPDSAI